MSDNYNKRPASGESFDKLVNAEDMPSGRDKIISVPDTEPLQDKTGIIYVQEDEDNFKQSCGNIKSNGDKETVDDKEPGFIKICPECGTEYPEYMNYCTKIKDCPGKKKPIALIYKYKCPKCKFDIHSLSQKIPNLAYCPECGMKLKQKQILSFTTFISVKDIKKRYEGYEYKKICPQCGSEINTNWEICANCGTKIIELKCHKCGRPIQRDEMRHKYCPLCGRKSPLSVSVKDKLNKFIPRSPRKLIEFGKWKINGVLVPIKWKILDKMSNGTVLLLSNDIVELHAYHSTKTSITWADSEIRQWLNGYFYENAFSEEEKEKIKTVRLQNADNIAQLTQEFVDWGHSMGYDWSQYLYLKFHTIGGKKTDDKIWLLSLEDLKKYKIIRAKTGFGFINRLFRLNRSQLWWWLRSPGGYQDKAAYISPDGFLDIDGRYVDFSNGGVRPALIIKP